MYRSKPRYPLQLDNAFVELCKHYDIEPFALECMLVAVCVLSPLGDFPHEAMYESIERMLQKLSIKFSSLPFFTITVQTSFPVE